jgi:1,4-alpha-glucan branching enzyme
MPANMQSQLHKDEIGALVDARHGDPFAVLGMHAGDDGLVVRALLPHASRVQVIDAADGSVAADLPLIDKAGLFAGTIDGRHQSFRYRFRVTVGAGTSDVEDPYRFGPILTDFDLFLFGEGNNRRLFDRFGAHPVTIDGVDGVTFVLWAPNAQRVSVVGDFNAWDGRRNAMRRRTSGVWELFVPHVPLGSRYKYELIGPWGELLPLKADPFAFAAERPPATASLVAVPGKPTWEDAAWMDARAAANRRDAPISVYEVHLGSWQRAEGNRYLTYAELGDRLIPYVVDLGFTHIELMPVSEHPFDGSWGYQPVGLYAPTSRFGAPADFARFVERAHQAGIGVIIDWVPGHFPTDAHGLGRFDGTALYEHADPRQGFQPDWNTLVFNFGRNEVSNFLLANALFWLETYHIDGLRVDAVASMLYLDYSRKEGEWIPNRYGGRENLEAIAFLQRVNTAAYGDVPGIMTVAEESTAFPGVSKPVEFGGLGFGYKWNMGWMHDSLAYMHEDPIHRRFHQDELTFTFMYAFSENFVLPLSHDEVVHGKGSLLSRMPGDAWQQFANLRLYFGYLFANPGKKLLFMGGEFGQGREWNHDRSLDWHQLEDSQHRGVQKLIRDCNAVYRALPALHELDNDSAGFEWITSDKENSVVAFARRSKPGDNALAVAISNFTPVPREGYRLGVPQLGTYTEALNTDDARYGGSGIANPPLVAQEITAHGKPYSIVAHLPPLATVVFTHAP